MTLPLLEAPFPTMRFVHALAVCDANIIAMARMMYDV
jgi:hypothetical protein